MLDLELDAIVDICEGQEEPREDRATSTSRRASTSRRSTTRSSRSTRPRSTSGSRSTRRPRSRSARSSSSATTAISDDELRGAIATQRADALSFLNDSGTYSQDAFERDLLLVSAHYWDRGYANVKVGTPQLRLSRDKQYMYLSIPIDEGPVFTIGAVDFKGDLIGTRRENLERDPHARRARSSRARMIAEDREKLSNVLQGPGLRVRERPAADEGRPRQAARST